MTIKLIESTLSLKKSKSLDKNIYKMKYLLNMFRKLIIPEK